MAKPIKKQKINQRDLPNSSLFSCTQINIQSTHTEELVFALCGPIGSPLHKVRDELERILENRFGYTCKKWKLSEIIEELAGEVEKENRFERVKKLIDQGNDLRYRHGNSILADYAITQIAYDREEEKRNSEMDQFTSRRVCHIIDSIKNQEELEALKSVYRDMLYFIGVFSPLPVRQKSLEDAGMSLPQVYDLIDKDSGEEIHHGQTVRETFPLADFFLRSDSGSDQQLKIKLNRFLNIIFGIDVSTPSHDETAMYVAASSGGNSGCLSRQVGAALTDKDGEIISVGWNDVPKAGGNLHQYSPAKDPTSEADKRCMHIDGGKCFNDIEKNQIVDTIANSLIKEDLVKKEDCLKLVKTLKKSQIKNLIEFSRSIHAEMHAIITGSQKAGHRIKGGKLYCTTYPCHACARIIIAAGIKEVYYIEL